jgi:hypothetical protein
MKQRAWGTVALLLLAGCGGSADEPQAGASAPAAVAQLRTAMSAQVKTSA